MVVVLNEGGSEYVDALLRGREPDARDVVGAGQTEEIKRPRSVLLLLCLLVVLVPQRGGGMKLLHHRRPFDVTCKRIDHADVLFERAIGGRDGPSASSC